MCGAGEDADVRALQSDRSSYTLTALNSRARAAPADSRAARPCPSCAGPGGVFLGGGAERAATGTRRRAERPCAAWRTSLHAVVMRGVWVSVPSLVTPGRSAPPPPAQPYQRREISSWLARWFPKDPAKPVVAQKTPIRLELVAGKTYRWCVCGRSKNQPFCDGSHFFQRTGLSPLKFKAQETRTVALCTCKATQRPPYCDGTHKSEQVQKAEVGSPL
ncbi:CDGSH iron-sulfur domain-containing protein 3, mitochondrial [Mus caroli]|nr:CDGSH iron-sulfur domain-containing protein 3, mitochondrial [Mus caroli]